MDISPSLTVAHNPWLVCASLLTLRVVGVGAAWAWVLPPVNRAMAAATILLFGITGNALVAMFLAEAGCYAPALEATALILLAGGGGFLGRGRIARLPILPASVGTFLAVTLIMALPHRGEWIAGGWDPGIYVTQGVSVAQGNTSTPDPHDALSSFTPEELEAFTRQIHNYTEYLPVVPVDPESRQIQHFFFRLTPSWIAVLFRCGGLRAATRVNLFLAGPVALLFAGLLWSWMPRRTHVISALLLFLLHPVWIFMLTFPTTEMLQLMLLLGLILVRPRSLPVTAVLLFAAHANRFSFLPFAGLLLCAFAWMDPPRNSRADRLVLVLACVAGVWYDFQFCPVTIGRLDELVLPLVLAGSILLAASLCIGPRIREWLTARRLTGLFLAAVAGMLIVDVTTGTLHMAMRRNLSDALPFLGALLAIMALAGGSRIAHLDRRHQGILLFLAGAALATFTVAAITPLYPWAMRRHLIYTLPLLAGLSGVFAAWSWDHFPSRRWRAATAAAVLLVAASNAPRALNALTRTELDGLSSTLAEVVAHLEPGDIVVADHFRWGTPLMWLYDVNVLNGELLWNPKDSSPDRIATAQQALERLRGTGHRIVLFTSTDLGPEVFPGDWETLNPIWSSGPIPVRDLHHREHETGFSVKERTKVFALYLWPDPLLPSGP